MEDEISFSQEKEMQEGMQEEGRGKRGLSFSLQGRAGIPHTATERGVVGAQLCVSSD